MSNNKENYNINLPINLINLIKTSKKKKKKTQESRVGKKNPSQSSIRRAAEAKSQKNRRCARIEESVHATINFDVVRRSADTNAGGGGKG